MLLNTINLIRIFGQKQRIPPYSRIMICCISALICREATGRFDGEIASKYVLDAESYPTSSQRANE